VDLTVRGSIKKRVGKRGVYWDGSYSFTDPATGKRKHRTVTAPTRRELEAKLRDAIKAVESGRLEVDDRLTVRELVDQWLASKEATVRSSTYRRYADLMRGHILPAIGGVRLARLSPAHLQQLYADRLATGLSSTSVNHLHFVLHGALHQAVRWGLVVRNVSEMVDPPRRKAPEAKTWNATQVAAFLAAGDETHLVALWRLALLTGMRRGELLGLKWEDVDLEKGFLSVQRTLSRGKGGTWELGRPKTTSGRRSIALPSSCVTVLRKHRAAQHTERLRLGPIWEDNGFVFTNHTGGWLHVNSLMYQYTNVIEAAEVPRIRFHDLRHTSATMSLAQGTHPKIVQERLGHSDIGMTLNRYSHVTPGMQREAADALDKAIEDAAVFEDPQIDDVSG
jgi:integrase